MAAKHPELAVNEFGRYEVRWRENNVTKRESLRTTDPEEARQAYAHWLLRTQPAPSYTVAQAWQLRQAEGLRHTVDKARIGYAWQALLPHFGSMDISSMTASDVDEYIDERQEEVSLSTIRRELSELKTTINFLVKTRRMAQQDTPYIELPPESAARPHYLSEDQCKLVLEAAAKRRSNPDEYTRLELFLLIALHTGQRRRAIETLEWDQVDFQMGMIHFTKQGQVLTKKRRASVFMRAELLQALQKEHACRKTPWVLRMSGSVRGSFDSLMDSLGLPHVMPHTLRHTFISLLLMRGVDVLTVSRLVAVSINQIEKTYGHLSAAHLQAALAKCA